MKKLTALLLCLTLLALSATACLAETYTASADGIGGPVTVEMTVEAGKITALTVVSHNETAGISDGAIERIAAAVVSGQTLSVDAVAGATVTSDAILAAAKACAEQAGLDVQALSVAGAQQADVQLTPGTYTATRHGHHSDITVEVKVTQDAIESVAVTKHGETTNISDTAYAILTERIVEVQSYGIDTVAGATFTSSAVLNAVADCMEQAGGAQAAAAFGVRVESEPWSTEEKTLEADVVVVGSGMAGICAAVAAQDGGAKVIMLEKLPYVNANGQRVISEEFYCGGSSQTFVNPDSRDYYWIVINEANASASEVFKTMLDAALAQGDARFFKEDSLAKLANDMKIPYTALAYTLNHYNTLCKQGEDTDFYKSAASLVAMEEGPWYAIKAYVNYFGTVGGLVTDENGAVLNEAGERIPGLYAAGENANGGLFNLSYIGGHAIGGGAVFGRLAGEQAALEAR